MSAPPTDQPMADGSHHIPGIGYLKLPTDRVFVPSITTVEAVITKFPQFTNVIEIMHAIINATDATKEDVRQIMIKCIPSIVTCLVPAIGSIFINQGIMEAEGSMAEVPESSKNATIDSTIGHLIRFNVLECLCTIVKPFEENNANADYIVKRYHAFCASINIPPKDHRTMFWLKQDEWKPTIDASQKAKNLICFYLETHEETDHQLKALLDQVKLVWKGYGMTMSTLMYKFATESNSVVLLRGILLKEAADFKQKYELLEKKLGNYFLYARIMNNPEIDALNNREFSTLYNVANRNAFIHGQLQANFRSSKSILTSIPLAELDQDLKRELPPGARTFGISETSTEYYTVLGIDPDKVQGSETNMMKRIQELFDRGFGESSAKRQKKQ